MSPVYMFKRYGMPVLLVMAGFLLFKQMAGMKKEEKRGAPKAFVRSVHTLAAAYGPVTPVVTAGGRVRARDRVSLTPETGGIVLADGFRLRKGAAFAEGDVLLRIDNRQAANSLGSARADLRNALGALLPELKLDMPDAYDRWSAFLRGASGDTLPPVPESYDEREVLLVNRFNVYKLYYTARNLELTLERHTLRAPFSGTVAQADVFPGDMARAGAAVAELVRTDAVEIELALPAGDAARVRPGDAARVSVDGAAPVRGTVHRKGALLDETTQAVPVFVRVSGALRHGVLTGAYAQVTLSGRAVKRAVSVPRKALHGGDRVYVVTDGTLAERTVAVAYLGRDDAVVTGGVDEGALVVSEPLQDAVLGMPVRSADVPGAGDGGGSAGTGKGAGKGRGAAE